MTTGGDVKRLTNDGYVWSSLSYSPDGQFLLSERTFGTGDDHREEAVAWRLG